MSSMSAMTVLDAFIYYDEVLSAPELPGEDYSIASPVVLVSYC